jgi:hypothetical protein
MGNGHARNSLISNFKELIDNIFQTAKFTGMTLEVDIRPIKQADL